MEHRTDFRNTSTIFLHLHKLLFFRHWMLLPKELTAVRCLEFLNISARLSLFCKTL